MQALARDKVLRRGRPSQSILVVQIRSHLLRAGILIVASVLVAAAFNALWLIRGSTNQADTITRGQDLILNDFAQQRGYIRYQVAGPGPRYWGNAIAIRFASPGKWPAIAKTTLRSQNKKDSPEEIKELELHLEIGAQLRIPILWQ